MRSPSTSAATPAASGSGSGSAWTIVRRCVGTGQGDVQGPEALDLRADDARRLDDDDAIDLEALGQADRHDRDLDIETRGGRSAVGDAGVVEGRRDLAGHLVRDDHDDAHPARSAVKASVASATALPTWMADPTVTISGRASPSRTDRGARRPGVAACITPSASCMI